MLDRLVLLRVENSVIKWLLFYVYNIFMMIITAHAFIFVIGRDIILAIKFLSILIMIDLALTLILKRCLKTKVKKI